MSEWLQLSQQITSKLEEIYFKHSHAEWLLSQVLQKVTHMTATVETFVAEMTAKMATMEAGIASLRPFIEGLFAQIGAIPGLTPAQMSALDAIEAKVDTDAAAIVSAMGPPAPKV